MDVQPSGCFSSRENLQIDSDMQFDLGQDLCNSHDGTNLYSTESYIQKYYESYENALNLSGLQSSEEKRELMSLKFAKNCLKNHNLSKLFPKNEMKHVMKKVKVSVSVLRN